VDNATKGAWIRRLQTVATEHSALHCLEHKQPLIHGTIPGYSFEGLVPTCCDLQHLPPSLMIKVLELGSWVAPSASKSKINPVSEFLGGIVFYFWEKKQKKMEDGLDRLQYNFKFKDVLGEWILE
jgi:hypothetical protein